MPYHFIDTHAHLDGEEFRDDLPQVIERAKDAGVGAIFIPGINAASVESVMRVCRNYPDYCYPMIGLQPEEVRGDWKEVLKMMKDKLDANLHQDKNSSDVNALDNEPSYIAIGECGLDFYWSREYEKEQLAAFEEQVKWSVETQLPLMIHCRKAQNELLHIMKPYEKELPVASSIVSLVIRKKQRSISASISSCLG